MAVAYDEAELSLQATCFEGTCQYKIGRHSSVAIPTGQRVNLNPAEVESPPQFEAISFQMARQTQTFLSQFVGGPADIDSCLSPYLVPPPTATPIPTLPPTATPVPTQVVQPTSPPPVASNPNPPAAEEPSQPVEEIIAVEVPKETEEATPVPPTPTPNVEPTATSDPVHPTPTPAAMRHISIPMQPPTRLSSSTRKSMLRPALLWSVRKRLT